MDLDIKSLIVLGIYAAVTGVLNLIVGNKSQIDAWAETNPRLAAVLKTLRAVGFDPWMVIQGLSLFFRGKLPRGTKPPLLFVVALLMLMMTGGCASAKSLARTADDLAENACALFFAERAGVSVEEAAKAFCSTREQLEPFIDELTKAQREAARRSEASGAVRIPER